MLFVSVLIRKNLFFQFPPSHTKFIRSEFKIRGKKIIGVVDALVTDHFVLLTTQQNNVQNEISYGTPHFETRQTSERSA